MDLGSPAEDEHTERGDARRHPGLVAAGIDVGSVGSQAVILLDHSIVSTASIPEHAGDPDVARRVLSAALDSAGMTSGNVDRVVGTGRGGAGPFVNRTVSEVSCHARGVGYSVGPSARTVVVMGGQDCAVAHSNERGRVTEFLMNACRPALCRENSCGGCGAAQGQGIDAVAETLAVPIGRVGEMSLSVDEVKVSALLSAPFDERGRVRDDMLEEIGSEIIAHGGALPVSGALGVVCAVIAKAHAAGLLRNGWSKAEIFAVYCAAMAHQAASLVRRLGPTEDFVVTGGVAKNQGVVKRLETELGINVLVPEFDPQLTGALGAALYASDFAQLPRQATATKGQRT